MKAFSSVAFRNIKGKPVRSAVLVFLAAVLSFTLLGGTLIVSSLRSGLGSLGSRLGADIMVVPYEAATKSELENIVLQGNTGYFYMDSSSMEKVAAREGVGQMSCQFFLASASSSCCSIPVQLIGFDPETDFTISPWIKTNYDKKLGLYDVVAGNDLNAFVGDELTFYGQKCRVAAKLDKTGTSFDTTVFADNETIKALIQSSLDLNMNTFLDADPDRTTSCILINAADGYSPEEVVNDINLHVKRVKAVQTKEMISGISDSLGGISDTAGFLVAAVWVLSFIILSLVFTMSINERKKEFAVLRILGASRLKLASIVLKESLLTCLAGGVLGTLICVLTVVPFNGIIEEKLSMPFLLPGAGTVAAYAAASLLASIAVGAVSAVISAVRVSRIDAGVVMRGDN